MSDIIDAKLPVQVQQRIISTSLNSQILQNFTAGVYTVVYVWTMCLYVSRTGPSKRAVVSAISLLYMMYLSNWIIQIYWMDQEIVVSGETRESILALIFFGSSQALVTFNYFIFYFGFAVADTLLIWRCYHVWGKSFPVIFIPLALLLTEIGLIITNVILISRDGTLPVTHQIAVLLNAITSALVLVSFATTVVTTFLIGYRIHKATRQNSTISKNRFRYIVVMIVESALVASINLLVLAILFVIPSFSIVGTTGYDVSSYVQAVASGISGMVPTILMARLAVKSPDGDTISAPTFILTPDMPDLHPDSAQGAADTDNHHEGTDGESHSMIEIHEVARASVLG